MIAAFQGASAAATIVGMTVGGAALMIGFGWRQHRMRESLKALSDCLQNPNPIIRADTARAAAALGLERSAGILLRAARTEQDPTVLQAIEAAVGSRIWEPITTPDAAELRRWASEQAAPEGASRWSRSSTRTPPSSPSREREVRRASR